MQNKLDFSIEKRFEKHQDKIKFIENYEFHPSITERCFKNIEKKFNVILDDDIKEGIVLSLKDYFISRYAGFKSVGMPSLLADELWHTFIFYTNEYFSFCENLGGYIHHNPTDIKRLDAVTEHDLNAVEEFRIISRLRTFYVCCVLEEINPFTTNSLPLLFNIDMCVEFDDGKYYDLNDIKKDLNQYVKML